MKIDFVITYLDGNDEEWIQEKDKYLLKENKEVDSTPKRFRNWDNLHYWFRGIEKFAPWVNKVFFVTCGQHPDWLNTDNEKLVLIDHKDYMPEEYLPSFSASPIELNLHRIKDLSEHFVFFNDDFFLTSYTKESDFFINGLPCDSFVEDPLTFKDKETINDIIINDMIVINSRFSRREVLHNNRKKIYSLVDRKGLVKNLVMSMLKRDEFVGLEFAHIPQPFLKSMFNTVWKDNYDLLDRTSKSKFRSPDDVNQWLIKFYQLLMNKFTPYNWRKSGHAYHLVDSGEFNNIDEACEAIIQQKYKMVCLNDSKVCDFETTKNKINDALDSILKDKCSFEK